MPINLYTCFGLILLLILSVLLFFEAAIMQSEAHYRNPGEDQPDDKK